MNNSVSSQHAVRAALFGASASTVALPLPALGQDQSREDAISELGRQTVTGSRIRRIDIETSSPVFTIDRNAIDKTGAVTLGQLVQEIPIIAGAATNPQVNNTGGTGASTISLRGVGAERTLVLLDGRRFISDSGTGVDVNAIPINLIERVEILKAGASAIYGSDAIGGVVNFITRKDFDGFEFAALRGESSRNDAALNSLQLSLGSRSERSHFMLGAVYDERDPVSSADRPFSEDPFGLYNGQQLSFPSTRTPTGFYRVPRSIAVAGSADLSHPQCQGSSANVVLTRRADRPGTAISDYRCYVQFGPGVDGYDFQDVNVVVTPQERYGLFVQGEHDISDALNTFLEGIYHYTDSNFQIAPAAFDGRPGNDDAPASGQSIYNPFGVDIGDIRYRVVQGGNREGHYDSNRFQVTVGVGGPLPREWGWQSAYTWGQQRRTAEKTGDIYQPALAAALGPSYRDAQGVPQCGTPSTPIESCTPINFFSVAATPQEAAETAAAIAALVPKQHDLVRQDFKIAAINADGPVLEMPAGKVGVAIGAEYREESLTSEPDFLAQNALVTDRGSAASQGSLSVREAYAEINVPILGDRPGMQLLELDAGLRYSDYSTFGETTNAKYGLEWRAGAGLLLRGTYAEVFRAPTVSDLFTGLVQTNDFLDDPCTRLTQAIVDANPNAARACANVPRDGTFVPTEPRVRLLIGGNPELHPESGEVITYGIAWTPPAAARLYLEVDSWRIELEDTIGLGFGAQVISDACFQHGLLCELVSRDSTGEAIEVLDIERNLGSVITEGVDFAIQYTFGESPLGRFRTRLDTTYLVRWDAVRIAGAPETTVREAGQFSESEFLGSGHFARWRGLASVDWSLREFSGALRARYIGTVVEDNIDFCDPTFNANGCANLIPEREIDDQVILNLQGTWRSPWGVDITLGVDNATDELAPLMYSGFNGTTDVRTYDGIGRFYYLRLAFKG